MRRRIISSLMMLGLALLLISCSKDEGAKPLFDFGKAKYKEPFVGLLKGKPSFLVKSLQYPPFSWCASDTVCLQKDLVISFNEDCIRSRSEALIQIRDSLFAPLSGVEIYCNDEYSPNGDFSIKADSLEKQVTLKCVISPELGDTALQGNIYVQGIELDAVNGEMLQQDNNVVATWECRQVIGWPLMLWLLWLVVAALVFALIFYFLRWSYFAASMFSGITRKDKEMSTRPKEESKTSPKNKNEDLVSAWVKVYMDESNSLHVRSEALMKILQRLEEMEEKQKMTEYNAFPPKLKRDYDTLWQKLRLPVNGGHWQGKPGNSLWIPDDDLVPPSKNSYNNMYGKTWGQLKKEYNIKGTPFKGWVVDFSRIAKEKVEIEFPSTPERYGKKGEIGIHERAFSKMAEKLGCSVEEARKIKEDANLVWHEVEDCKTMLLVPREIHDNITHMGGIAMAKLILGIVD